MNPLSWVIVFVEVCPVEVSEPVLIVGEVGGYPVEDYTYVILV
jgi:hypothetical protein